jgi:hypothetical protein
MTINDFIRSARESGLSEDDAVVEAQRKFRKSVLQKAGGLRGFRQAFREFQESDHEKHEAHES